MKSYMTPEIKITELKELIMNSLEQETNSPGQGDNDTPFIPGGGLFP